MDFTIEAVGTSPLLMCNPRLVDPDYEITREIKSITSKKKKTDSDLEKIAMLEWYGGLHSMDDANGNHILSQPVSKIRKATINAGRINKLGKHIERAVAFKGIDVPLIYDGPKNIDELYLDSDGKYTSRLSVVVSMKRVMRIRPKFDNWSLTVEGTLIDDAGLNTDEFERIAVLAGKVCGIGDNRPNGYGRYDATVTWVQS